MELRHASVVLVLLGLMATRVSAGEEARPVSSPALEAMGLAGMQPLGDAEGATVRGKFTFAWVRGVVRAGGVVRPYADVDANATSRFRIAINPQGGGSFGVAFGGARAWAN